MFKVHINYFLAEAKCFIESTSKYLLKLVKKI